MKKTRSLDKATGPGKPIPGTTSPVEKASKPPDESNLSPERIQNGASSTTALLSQILAQREAMHQLRDWGINE
jgi:hypothetical protein